MEFFIITGLLGLLILILGLVWPFKRPYQISIKLLLLILAIIMLSYSSFTVIDAISKHSLDNYIEELEKEGYE